MTVLFIFLTHHLTRFFFFFLYHGDSPVAQRVYSLPAVQETKVRGKEDPLEKGMATHSGTLAWRVPWMEEPGGLQSMESQRIAHD